MGVVQHLLEHATQMKWKPAQSEDQHQGEDGFSHFPALQRGWAL